MTRNFGFSSLLAVAVLAILMIFIVPVVSEQVDGAKQFIASQEPTLYTGQGLVTDARTDKTTGKCLVDLIAETSLVTAQASTCAGIELGDTVEVVNNNIK